MTVTVATNPVDRSHVVRIIEQYPVGHPTREMAKVYLAFLDGLPADLDLGGSWDKGPHVIVFCGDRELARQVVSTIEGALSMVGLRGPTVVAMFGTAGGRLSPSERLGRLVGEVRSLIKSIRRMGDGPGWYGPFASHIEKGASRASFRWPELDRHVELLNVLLDDEPE